mmetsp:Transcript_13123/g.25006  ORF Transcript_13123/g.25006 Transcript_13123/m.25006 type:complete len:387 (-) Transcript_13123:115-1275(-)
MKSSLGSIPIALLAAIYHVTPAGSVLTLSQAQALVDALTLDTCTVDFSLPTLFQCTFNSTSGYPSAAEVLLGPCSSHGDFNRPASGEVLLPDDKEQVTASVDITQRITLDVKQSGYYNEFFCARMDVFDDDGMMMDDNGNGVADRDSVGAVKYDIDADIHFSDTAQFSLEGIAVTRAKVYYDELVIEIIESIESYRCDADGNEITEGVVEIGDTLHICVYSTDPNVDVSVTSLELQDSSGQVIATPIDREEGPSFVTEVEDKMVEGFSFRVELVSTLLTTDVFDQAGGEMVGATGTAMATYTPPLDGGSSTGRVRQLGGGEEGVSGRNRRRVQIVDGDSAPFRLEFRLAEREMPTVVKAGNGVYGRFTNVVATTTLFAAIIAVVFV